MRYAAFLFLILTLAACAASTSTQSTRRSNNLITTEEIAGSTAKDAIEAINLLRPQWLTSRGESPTIYLNNSRVGSAEMLRSVLASNIAEIRYLTSSEATTYFGTGNAGGAIVVKTK